MRTRQNKQEIRISRAFLNIIFFLWKLGFRLEHERRSWVFGEFSAIFNRPSGYGESPSKRGFTVFDNSKLMIETNLFFLTRISPKRQGTLSLFRCHAKVNWPPSNELYFRILWILIVWNFLWMSEMFGSGDCSDVLIQQISFW